MSLRRLAETSLHILHLIMDYDWVYQYISSCPVSAVPPHIHTTLIAWAPELVRREPSLRRKLLRYSSIYGPRKAWDGTMHAPGITHYSSPKLDHSHSHGKLGHWRAHDKVIFSNTESVLREGRENKEWSGVNKWRTPFLSCFIRMQIIQIYRKCVWELHCTSFHSYEQLLTLCKLTKQELKLSIRFGCE